MIREYTRPAFIALDCSLPPDWARLYHLSWVFLSEADRVAKAGRYDQAGQGAWSRENQLFHLEDVVCAPLDDDFFQQAFSDWVASLDSTERRKAHANPRGDP